MHRVPIASVLDPILTPLSLAGHRLTMTTAELGFDASQRQHTTIVAEQLQPPFLSLRDTRALSGVIDGLEPVGIVLWLLRPAHVAPDPPRGSGPGPSKAPPARPAWHKTLLASIRTHLPAWIQDTFPPNRCHITAPPRGVSSAIIKVHMHAITDSCNREVLGAVLDALHPCLLAFERTADGAPFCDMSRLDHATRDLVTKAGGLPYLGFLQPETTHLRTVSATVQSTPPAPHGQPALPLHSVQDAAVCELLLLRGIAAAAALTPPTASTRLAATFQLKQVDFVKRRNDPMTGVCIAQLTIASNDEWDYFLFADSGLALHLEAPLLIHLDVPLINLNKQLRPEHGVAVLVTVTVPPGHAYTTTGASAYPMAAATRLLADMPDGEAAAHQQFSRQLLLQDIEHIITTNYSHIQLAPGQLAGLLVGTDWAMKLQQKPAPAGQERALAFICFANLPGLWSILPTLAAPGRSTGFRIQLTAAPRTDRRTRDGWTLHDDTGYFQRFAPPADRTQELPYVQFAALPAESNAAHAAALSRANAAPTLVPRARALPPMRLPTPAHGPSPSGRGGRGLGGLGASSHTWRTSPQPPQQTHNSALADIHTTTANATPPRNQTASPPANRLSWQPGKRCPEATPRFSR